MATCRAVLNVAAALALISLAAAASAQQTGTPPGQQPPALAAPVTAAPEPAASTATATENSPATADNSPRAAKTIPVTLHELSPWSMFLAADVLVKAVMIGLAFASLLTWTILIAKSIELSAGKRRLRRALRKIAEARSMAEAQLALGPKNNVVSALLDAGLREAKLSAGMASDSGIKERAASRFAEIARAEARRVRLGMGLLATIGATAPFVGLFGTVWGIMNSFIGISKSQTTNLAVVAPGIAEALLATAIGLAAAIPAVIIYNHFSRVTKAYLELVSRGQGAVSRLLSRDLDRSHLDHSHLDHSHGGMMASAAE
ncbi:MAG: tonB-system energizer ExbB [Bradyrhizobium sp.]|uniref:tonB-system energizer ExbB n=1 Tax=Bradyrhizobium sp. TaxID=376 RepID=UPI001DAA0AB5|nr:tonB-system energizer ExbB [Bradyrhizobium sp.]MBV9564738.1 tonB-system energizer ExbB [Bradyrhizobium sp.]